MIFPYIIDTTQRRARITITGSASGQDIAETSEAIYCDPQWQAGFDTIWDATGVTELLLTLEDMSRILKVQLQYEARAGAGRDVALVVRQLDATMVRVYAKRAQGIRRLIHVAETESGVAQILQECMQTTSTGPGL